MQKESLLKVLDLMVDTIVNSDIASQDKVELLINLKYFLDPKDYENNINILSKVQRDKRFERK